MNPVMPKKFTSRRKSLKLEIFGGEKLKNRRAHIHNKVMRLKYVKNVHLRKHICGKQYNY